jgi:hypothetical protein
MRGLAGRRNSLKGCCATAVASAVTVHLIHPERAALVEHRDAVLRKDVVRARSVDGGAHGIEDRLFRPAVILRR